MRGFHFQPREAHGGTTWGGGSLDLLGSLGSLGSLGLLGTVGADAALAGRLAGRLATAALGAGALQGVATLGLSSAKARLAFFSASFLPMIGGWPRASR